MAKRPTPIQKSEFQRLLAFVIVGFEELGAELGGEEGFYLLRFDEQAGQLSFDTVLNGGGQTGYLSLRDQSWPHGPSGPAWGHAALFLPQ